MKTRFYAAPTFTRHLGVFPNAARTVLPSHKATRDTKAPEEDPGPSRKQEPTIWILIVGILILSLAAGYALWAKVESVWPFSQ
jgi:hypothetical protein